MDKCGTPNLLKVMKKKKVGSFTGEIEFRDTSAEINRKLKQLNLDADNVITITTYHKGPHHKYTVWYRK